MNKKELIENLENQRELFLDVIDNLTEETLGEPGVTGTWSIKDILAHISRWEAELVKLLWQISQGQRPNSMHFTNKGTVDQINQVWYEESARRTTTQILDDFHSVRNQTILRVEVFSDRDLIDPKRYPVLGGRALWEYVEDDSFGHEAEHLIEINNWLEQKKTS
jgi:hypothetical protein